MNRTITKKVQLHRSQAAFVHSTAIYKGFVGGRGSGKSYAGAYDLIKRAKRGRLYLVASPTYTILSDTTIRTFVTLARHLQMIGPDSVRKSPPAVTLSTGAEILFRSADEPERLRGPNLSGCWLDEASLMDRDAYDIVIASLREAGEQGWLSATFTPKGLSHWTYEYFGKDRPNTQLFHATTFDNPFLSSEFAATLRDQYASAFAAQELEGRFVNVEGAEWPGAYFGDHVWFDDWPATINLRTMALDPSKGKDAKKGDYAAFVFLGRDGDGTLYVDADMGQGRHTSQLVQDGLEHVRQFRPDGFAVESNQFQELLAADFERQSKERGIMAPIYRVVNTVNKLVRIRRLTPYLARGNIRFKRGSPGCAILVQQLRDFPMASHDDGPDAAEMALRLAIEIANGRMLGSKQPARLKI